MTDLKRYTEMGYSVNQIHEIQMGLAQGLDVTMYAKREFFSIQMRQIRLGLQEGLSVEVYAKNEYDWFQMEEIRKGLQEKVDVKLYADSSISYDRMRQIREGLLQGINLSPYKQLAPGVLKVLRKAIQNKVSIFKYISEGYEEQQLEEICEALIQGLDIAPYIFKELRGISIREIAEGLKHNIDVSLYATIDYDWRQMRQIRLGLINRVEVKYFLNPLYDWEQMQEIRLVLENGVDVVPYRSFMYPGAEMRQKRIALEEKAKAENEFWLEKMLGDSFDVLKSPLNLISSVRSEYDDFSISVSSDEMEVYFSMKSRPHPISKSIIDDALEKSGITMGLIDETISQMVNGDWKENVLKIAEGALPENGQDGWYEFFFRTSVARTPKILDDGSVDFHDIEWYEMVKKNQKLAEYHPAVSGINGYTVKGDVIPAIQGKELPVLGGSGFYADKSGMIYYSSMDGIIELNDNLMMVKRVLVLDEVSLATGNVSFDGDIYVKGNVISGMSVTAGGDLVVDGYVEKVRIRAGGNVVLRQGVNSSGDGHIIAGKSVIGTFFEAVCIFAGEDIEADSALNCELSAEGHIQIQGKKGSLIGGTAGAELGISVKDLGNRNGIATYVRLCSQERHTKNLELLEKRIKTVCEELSILNNAHLEYRNKMNFEDQNVNQIFVKIENAIYTKEKEKTELEQQKRKLELLIKEISKSEIVVFGTLYDGVVIDIGNVKMTGKFVKGVRVRKVNNRLAMFSLV